MESTKNVFLIRFNGILFLFESKRIFFFVYPIETVNDHFYIRKSKWKMKTFMGVISEKFEYEFMNRIITKDRSY